MGIQDHLWEFPCTHHLKVMGLAQFPIREVAIEVITTHAPDIDHAGIACKTSSSGKYLSVTVPVTFTHKEQVEAVFLALHQREEITMTL